MILWTIQHKSAYEKMRKSGVLRANEAHLCDDSFTEAYLWMSGQMTKRIGNSPEGVIFPVWAWYKWEGERKRLDMRAHGRHWGTKGSPIVLLTVDVPENFVLLSDFDYWHVVLNNGDIIFPHCEEAIYSQEEKKKSWENIFDIDCSYDGEQHQYLTTQATLWEMRWEWVIKAENFISR
ncbi:protein of unknown function [Anaerosporobacter mobilis DSM 15930]|jgi:hypothetical protein|uniref:DUF3841 domain-containing protein n=1 Tax=Anaerosporobacter mobilis DSM 15930 TaxID=1120996 RepID=A0A1M7NBN2_9FIRM|nr:DUF3841 domain-containing protein [Anaerosporobacter mobilis]SHN00532.1 protein of unknown function [Anaerosporobacter mobilis DSM 15930]